MANLAKMDCPKGEKVRVVNIGDLKNNLSRYLSAVRKGEELVVKDRNKPIARIVPFADDEMDESELAELVSLGLARPPRTRQPLPGSFWTDSLPETGADLVRLIREDRDAR
jgi:prevent-host-death family protein